MTLWHLPAWHENGPWLRVDMVGQSADFYGFLGEPPFGASFERVDFTGFQTLECLNLTIVTQADEPSLLDEAWVQLHSSFGSEIPQVGAVRINISEEIVAVVWRDNSNTTFANTMEVHLPLPWVLRQTATGAECQLDCWDAVSVKVATASGRHGLANIRATHSSVVTGFTASVEYYSYSAGNVHRFEQQLTAGPPPHNLLWGRSVFGNSEDTSSVALSPNGGMFMVEAATWPQQTAQWTISTMILECRDHLPRLGGRKLWFLTA